MPTSPVSPQIALARSLSEQERRRRQAAEAQVRPRLNDPILRKFLRLLLWLTTHARQLKIVGGALQASLAWAETSAMSAQLQELQHEIVSPKSSHSGSCAIQLGLTWMLPAGAE